MKIVIYHILGLGLKIIAILIPVLISVAYLTLAERKILGAMQKRKGPNIIGYFGLLQPFADALKLISKETVLPSNSSKIVFVIAPILTFFLSLLSWAVIPFGEGLVYAEINLGVLYIFAVSSLGVYGIVIAGWSSNSKYAFLGALRSAAQMISYEISMGLIVLSVILCSGSLNLNTIVLSQSYVWYCVPLLPNFLMFIISILAETNRSPFDLPEAEAELVSGYNVEYSSMGFALFFLGEYANILLMSSLTVILFLGGWLPIINVFPLNFIPGPIWFGIKTCFIVFIFIWVRASLPRYRYDQLMYLGWKSLLPLSLLVYIVLAFVIFFFNYYPSVFEYPLN